MPSFFKHDRANDLFPPASESRQSNRIFPVTRLTRKDIESKLQKQVEGRLKIRKIYADHLEQQQQSQSQLRLQPIPPFQLFPEEPSITAAPHNHNAERGSLSLRRVPKFSLFGDTDAVTLTTTRSPQQDFLTLRTDEYAQQRRECVDKHHNTRIFDGGRDDTAVDPLSTENIVRALLGDNTTPTTSSYLSAPTTATSTSSTSGTLATYQETPIVSTLPQQQQQQQQQSAEPQTSTTSAPLFLSSVYERSVPVFATTMQKQGCDKITQAAKTRNTSSFLKIRFEEMIGLLNHPLVAMMDVYEETVNDKWSGSGKTLFIKQLVENLQAEHMSLKIAIATYDIDTESFLYDCIKNDLELPCLRIGSILDDAWQSEYGVVFQTQKSRDTMRQNSEPNADLVISFDVRLRPDNGVFTKIASKRGTDPVPLVWLFTVGSVEQRAITYFNRHTSDGNNNKWWYDEPKFRKIVLEENTWPPAEANEEMALRRAITTITTWAQSNFAGPYLFSIPTTTRVTEPPPTAAGVPVSVAPSIPSSSSSSTTTETQAIVPQPTPLPVTTDQLIASSSSSSIAPAPALTVTTATTTVPEPASTAVQQVPDITTESDVDITDVSSEMEVDSDRHAEHIELPECIKAQIKQILRYPTLHASFDRPYPSSRHGSPSITNRSRSRHSRGLNAEGEEDDDGSSFYSASEFVQDVKPLLAANSAAAGGADLENGVATGNSISLKLGPIKSAFEKEYQTVITRMLSQYDQEMKALLEKYEKQAIDKLQSGS